MLKFLKVRNFLSICDEVELNFEAHTYWGKKENVFHIWKNAFAKSTLIYGANGTGKSTLLRAMWIIWHFTLHSALKGPMPAVPFLLDKISKNEASFFEIGFFLEKREYIYNFSLRDNKVVTENLIIVRWWKKVYLFARQGNQITQRDKSFESEIEKGEARMTETASFISVLNLWNGQLEWKPIGYFFSKINIVLPGDLGNNMTLEYLKGDNGDNKQLLIDFLKCADFDIDDIRVSEVKISDEILNQMRGNLPPNIQIPLNAIRIETWHKNREWEMQYFDLDTESSGTIRFFQLFWFLVKALKNEEMLFADEIETHLHPHVLKNLFNLIHTDLGRKYQFIFTTHNFDILDLEFFKKEQVKIIDKINGATRISSLFDYSDLRAEHDVRKMFGQWRFWWIPKNVKDFAQVMRKHYLSNEF